MSVAHGGHRRVRGLSREQRAAIRALAQTRRLDAPAARVVSATDRSGRVGVRPRPSTEAAGADASMGSGGGSPLATRSPAATIRPFAVIGRCREAMPDG
ncbi:MAG: hypothetical protein AVDCRST_MAG49-3082 [uncultured Thermomicrobiales bacterium]|uniref:Uncharacterized protein n=1 Tax=uncultured Thermomicrobiales bacterium TaxID=1645740 RepID=A0A6J4V1D8_9BACT|nr:MAG: hypothetical protein AVDCRST_MAG49-3082 [uncultured Thermomicrobiales bacterium]